MDVPPSPADRRAALAVACFGAFVAALSTSLVAISAPSVARDLGVTPAAVSWVLTAYLLTVSALLATAGRLGDVLGSRRVYMAGFGVYGLGGLACALAPSLGALVAARVVQGIGSAMLMATGPAIVARAFPPEQRARGLGTQLAFTYVGLTIGPTLGGLLVSSLGWHAVFATNAVAGLVGAVLAARSLPRPEAKATAALRFDPMGSLLLAVGLTALLLALRKDATAPIPTALVAVAVLVAFGVHEARHPSPILPVTLLRVPAFTSSLVGAMLLYVVLFVVAYALPFHLQVARGLAPARAGLLMTAQPAVMAVTAPLSGLLADRFGARLPSIVGMGTIAGGLTLLAAAPAATSVVVAVSLALLGLGAGLYVAPNNAAIMGAAPRERQGTAAAMAATARNVGMACGIALSVAADARLGFAGSMALAAGIALVAALLALGRRTRVSETRML